MSWVAKVASHKERIYFVERQRSGENAFFYIRIELPKEQDFLAALKGQQKFNLSDYGEIIASGFGNPSDEIRKMLKEKYGFDV